MVPSAFGTVERREAVELRLRQIEVGVDACRAARRSVPLRYASRVWPDMHLDEPPHHVGGPPVLPVVAGLEVQRQRRESLQHAAHGVARLRAAPPPRMELGLGDAAVAVGEPGGVRQDLLHRDRSGGRHRLVAAGQPLLRRRGHRHLHVRELRQPAWRSGRGAGSGPPRRASSGRPTRSAWSSTRCGRWRRGSSARRPRRRACPRAEKCTTLPRRATRVTTPATSLRSM